MVQALHDEVPLALGGGTDNVLYWENIEGGHGGAADSKQRAFMSVLAYDFLAQALAYGQLAGNSAAASDHAAPTLMIPGGMPALGDDTRAPPPASAKPAIGDVTSARDRDVNTRPPPPASARPAIGDVTSARDRDVNTRAPPRASASDPKVIMKFGEGGLIIE